MVSSCKFLESISSSLRESNTSMLCQFGSLSPAKLRPDGLRMISEGLQLPLTELLEIDPKSFKVLPQEFLYGKIGGAKSAPVRVRLGVQIRLLAFFSAVSISSGISITTGFMSEVFIASTSTNQSPTCDQA
jgi:hypothetical protein